MSSKPSSWSWDPNRNKYYYLDYQACCLRYQDGDIVQLTPAARDRFVMAAQQAAQASHASQPAHPLTQAESAQHRAIRGSGEGSHEELDPRYKVRKPANAFFKKGKVFRILWMEPAGPQRGTILSEGLAKGQSVHIKIRWFVVIREGPNFCSCLPIQTYEGKGVSKPSVVKSHHGIIHTSKTTPKEASEERAIKGQAMLPPVRVTPRSRADRMDDMSRVNYAKPYPVEHNVKVYDFGSVSKQSLRQFLRNFKKIWKLTEMPDSEESSDDDDDDNDDNDDDHDDGDNDDDEGRGPSGAGASIALQIQAAQKMLALAALGQSQEKQRTQQEIDVEINQNVQNWAAYLRNSGTEQGKQTAHFLLHASREQQIECIQRLLQTEQQMPALAAQEEQRTQQAIDAEFNQRVQTWVDYLRNVATEQSNASANYLLHANREEQVQYMQRLASNQQPSASAESSKGSSSKGKEKAHRKR